VSQKLSYTVIAILFVGLLSLQAQNNYGYPYVEAESTEEATPEITPEPTPDVTPPPDVQVGPVFIVTTTGEFADDGFCSESHCSLGEAIIAANHYAGAATIQLTTETYTFTTTQSSWTALPIVTGDVTIEGNDAIFERSYDYDTPSFRLMSNAGTLILNNLTLRNGDFSAVIGMNTPGGALYQSNGTLTLNNVRMTENFTSAGGGAVYIANGSATITDSLFSENTAWVSYGGAVSAESGTLVIDNSEFIQNSATEGGAVHGGQLANVTITDSSLVYNSAKYGGAVGGRYQLTIINSTLAHNAAETYGGAIRAGAVASGAALTIVNSTLVGNGRSAIWSETDVETVTIQHSIFAKHATNCELTPVWSAASQYNIIDDASCSSAAPDSTTQHSVNARVGGLGYYGGITQVIPLLPGSPAIDFIPATDCLQSSDQYGNSRPYNNACDSGAFETTIAAASADLRLSQTASASPVAFDDVITYTIIITNDGVNPADAVAIHSPITDGLVFVSANPQVGTYTPVAGIWEIGTVAAGTSITLELNLRLDENTDLTVSHYSEVVMSSAVDPDSTPNNGILEDDYAATTLQIVCTPRTITVPNRDVDGLIDAFEKASSPPCSTPHTIVLAENGTYTLDAVYDDLDSLRTVGLPSVIREVTIEGNGATIERDATGPSFRFIYVANTGQLMLNNVVMRGGLANRGTTMSVSGSNGGAIYNSGSTFIYDSFFTGNDVYNASASERGGAVFNSGSMVIERTYFLNNGGDAMVDYNPGSLSINASVFVGGIRALDTAGVATVSNSIFMDATWSAMLHRPFSRGDLLTINNSVIINNERGLQNISQTDTNIVLNGTIIQNNIQENCNGSPQGTYNISDDATCSSLSDPSNLHDTNIPLGYYNNGQGVITFIPLNDTPAIDAIPAASCPVVTDYYGTTRPIDTNGDGIAACDIGMVEIARTELVVDKQVANPTYAVGDIATFTITLTNQGAMAADSVSILDKLPEDLIFVTATSSKGTYDSVTGLWMIGHLSISESVTLQIQARVSGGASGGETNTASIYNSTANTGNLQDSASISVECPASYDWNVATGDNLALIDAILSANNETCFPGTNTIELTSDSVYNLNLVRDEANGAVALPSITSSIVINGHGATIERSVASAQMRLLHVASSGNLTINDVHLRNGSLLEADGGAIYNEGTLTINGSELSNNFSNISGGALYNLGTLNLNGTTIRSNRAYWGGGVYVESGIVSIVNSLFELNTSTNQPSSGAGLLIVGGNVTITNSIFRDNTLTMPSNTALGGGAAIAQHYGTLDIYRTLFDSNAVYGSAWGGAILIGENATTTIEDSIFLNNYASRAGGAIRNDYGTLTIQRSTFAENRANGHGGALNLAGIIDIANSTFSHNTSSDNGGAISATSANLDIVFSTFYGNSSDDDSAVDDHAVTHMAHNIFAQNAAHCNNNENDAADCGFDLRIHPLLRDNGGYTPTHALLSGSPLINAIAGVICPIATDQRGVSRPQNSGCDAGAFEWDAGVNQLLAPANLAVSHRTNATLTIRWQDMNSEESQYIIERNNGSGWVEIAVLASNSTEFFDNGADLENGLSCDVFYSYRVYAYRESNDDWSPVSDSTTTSLLCQLNTPINLAASSTVGDISLVWQDTNINEAAHEIERSTDNVNWVNLGTVGADVTTFTDTSALCETTYYYRVRAYRNVDANYSAYTPSLTTAISVCLQDGPVFTVTTTDAGSDTYCEVAHCTLREAFLAAQNLDNSTIQIPAGNYLPANAGEMVITRSNVRIEGAGAAATIINFNGQRPGIVVAANASATVVNLTLQAASTSNISVNNGASLTIEDSVVREALRGGIISNGGNVSVIRSQVIDNDNNVSGGGIGVTNANLTVQDSLVSGNYLIHTGQAQYGAGIYKYGTGDVLIDSSTVANNERGFRGQGVSLISITGTSAIHHIINTTISGNDEGVFIHSIDAPILLEHTTITNNNKGLGTSLNSPIVPTILHSIVAGNNSNLVERLPIDGGYNLTSGDPQLSSLQANGGLTPTHTLFAGSPAYDAIPSANCPLAIDQRSMTRPIGSGCDIGAVEASLLASPFPTPTNLSATAVDEFTIDLVWTDNASDETVYYVERRKNSEILFTRIAEIDADSTTYQDVLPACGVETYHYRVQAYRASDMIFSSYSNVASVTMPICPPPLAPSNMTATGELDRIIRIAWTDNSYDETAFFYQISSDGGNTWASPIQTGPNNNGATYLTMNCGVNYAFRVRAYRSNDNLYSEYSNIATITLVCPPPTALTMQDNATNITLNWVDNMSRETHYWIERRVAGGDWIEIGSVGQNVTTYVDTNVVCAMQLEYRVRGNIAFANTYSDYSNISGIHTCSPPANLAVVSTDSASVQLTWDDRMLSETDYRIERSVASAAVWVEVAILPADSEAYTDSELDCEHSFDYRVRAYRSSDSLFTGYSEVITAATAFCPVPRTPSDLSATAIDRRTIMLTWADNNSSPTLYHLERTVVGTGNWFEIAQVAVGTETFVDSRLVCNRIYDYRIRTFRTTDALFSSYSDIVTGTTLACPALNPPAAPMVIAVGRTSASIGLSLELSSEVNTYTIERRNVTGNTGWVQLAVVSATTTTFADTGLACATSYGYRLRGYRPEDTSYSPYSTETQIITTPCPMPFESTVGLYRNGLWIFTDTNATGTPDIQLHFGPQEAGWTPIVGDWDGDGIDGIGVYRNGVFILRNTTDAGIQDSIVYFGMREPDWQPIVGDWNGDGQDTVGVYKVGQFMLTNNHATSRIDHCFIWNPTGLNWIAIVGDWDASGADSVGLYHAGTFLLNNALNNTTPQRFTFGPTTAGWYPVVGDWNTDGTDTIGVFSQSIWRLRNSNSSGTVDIGFNFGARDMGWIPLASYRGGAAPLLTLSQAANIHFEVPVEATIAPTEPTVAAITAEATAEVTVEITPEATAEIVIPTETPVSAEPTAGPIAPTALPSATPLPEPTASEPEATQEASTP
jgi:uncharacterized repeat protein (TIGR01451 family)